MCERTRALFGPKLGHNHSNTRTEITKKNTPIESISEQIFDLQTSRIRRDVGH